MGIVSKEKVYKEAEVSAKDLLVNMNGLSDDGFYNKINNDPFFRQGYFVIVSLMIDVLTKENFFGDFEKINEDLIRSINTKKFYRKEDFQWKEDTELNKK